MSYYKKMISAYLILLVCLLADVYFVTNANLWAVAVCFVAFAIAVAILDFNKKTVETKVRDLRNDSNELSVTKSYLESVFNIVNDGLVVTDLNEKILLCNSTFLELYGYTFDELNKKPFLSLYPESEFEFYARQCSLLLEKQKIKYESINCKSDGGIFPVEITSSMLVMPGSNNSIIVSRISDITERKNYELQIIKKTEEQQILLDNIDFQVWFQTDTENFGAVNKALSHFIGLPAQEIIEKKIIDVFPDANAAKSLIDAVTRVFAQKQKVTFEMNVTRKNEKQRVFSVSEAPKLDKDGNIEYVICRSEDITQRKQAEEEILFLSFHDKVTGVYNRAFFEQELIRLDVSRMLPLSLIIGDVNGLKLANDVFGHMEGDKLLAKIASILVNCCRREDIIARWGGDEYAIILPKTTEKTAIEICDRITATCQSTESVPITPSIALGTACKTQQSQKIDDILKEAEDRMYRHKLLEDKSSRNSVISMMERILHRKNLETADHTNRIMKIVTDICREMNLSAEIIERARMLAVFHDIGNVAVPEEILSKPSDLDNEEWKSIKKHPEIGYRIAKTSFQYSQIAEAILQHHEKWNGEGYPQGLKGDDICLISRIIAIADAYDAMTNDRPFKKALSKETALKEIAKSAGNQFDPELVEVFLKVSQN